MIGEQLCDLNVYCIGRYPGRAGREMAEAGISMDAMPFDPV